MIAGSTSLYIVMLSFLYYTHNRHLIALEGLNMWGVLLTHWGRVTHICVSKLTIIGSDNGLSPDRRQAIIWTNAGLLLIGPLGTNFSEILIEILTFSFKKMRLKVSSAKGGPFCLGLNMLMGHVTLVAIVGTIVVQIFKSSHCNSFEDQAPIYRFHLQVPDLLMSCSELT